MIIYSIPMISSTKEKQPKKPPTMKELLHLKEKIKIEMLGQEDAEYRQELENLMAGVDKKIQEVQQKSK